jgi:hypothetical protein
VSNFKHEVKAENAPLIWSWFQLRGGISIWGCVDLADPGKTWTCPAKTVDGLPMQRQQYNMGQEPIRVITDPAEVGVIVPKEVKRFHVATRLGDQGFKVKVTSGSSDRIRKALDKAGDMAWHEFDYETQEAVIYIPSGDVVALPEWVSKSNNVLEVSNG